MGAPRELRRRGTPGLEAPALPDFPVPPELTANPPTIWAGGSDQGHRDGRRELAAGLERVVVRRPDETERGGDLLPAQGAGDRADRPQRARGVVVAVHVDAVRQPDGGLQARVVDGVEEVLEGAGHVADVRRRPQEYA